MKKWQVTVSEPAEIDLDEIYKFIAETLLNPAAAWRQFERIRDALSGLDMMPERGTILKNEPWRSRGLRRLIIDNYVIIYEIQEETDIVAVIAIIYSGRNFDDVLGQNNRQES